MVFLRNPLCLVFVNKAVLGHSQAYIFKYCLWMLSHYNSRAEKL